MTDATPLLSAGQVRELLAANGLASPSELALHEPGRAEGLEWGGLDGASATAALEAHQRLFNLGGDLELSERLMGRGFHSAARIATTPERAFVEGHGEALGLSPEAAGALHRRAVGTLNRTMHLMAAVHGSVASPHFRAMRVGSVPDDAVQRFQDLPSYQDLFGSLDYCGCVHCKSILGPAAYFVDLMRIVDEYVTTPNKATIPAGLTLDERRPDLQLIPLTCAKTNDTVPYLRIVNERLLGSLRGLTGIGSDDELLLLLASKATYPILLPYNDPLGRIRVLAETVGVELAEVYARWGGAEAAVVQESLGLSPERAAIVTTPAANTTVLAELYGTLPARLPELKQVKFFLEQTQLTVPQLQALIVQEVSGAEIGQNVPENLFINQGLGAGFLKLAQTGEEETSEILNLNDTALDSINRLRRLALPLGWPAPLADWVLRAVQNGGTPVLDVPALTRVERVRRLAAVLGLSPLQTSFFFGPIKSYGGGGEGGAAPFDQLFNDPDTVTRSGAYRPAPNPLNPLYTGAALTWKPGRDADTPALVRVSAGIGLTLDAATLLGKALYGDNEQKLTVDVLSALYRHALLSRAFDLPMERYLVLLELAGLGGTTVFQGPDLDALVEHWRWMAAARQDVYTLAYVVAGQRSVFVDPLLDPAAVKPWLGGLATGVPAGLPQPQTEEAITALAAIFFGVAVPLLTPVFQMALAAVDLPQGVTRWTDAFLAPGDPPPYLDYVTDVLEWTARWLVLAGAARLPADLLASVRAHPAAYGLPANFSALTLANVRDLERFAALAREHGDVRGDLVRALNLYAAGDDDGALAALHQATGWNPAQVRDIVEHEGAAAPTSPALAFLLQAAFAQLAAFGSDAAQLRALAGLAGAGASAHWADYNQRAAELLQKVSARYGRQAWSAISGGVDGRLNVALRDALLGVERSLLAAKPGTGIETDDDVYAYLLTDVLIGPEPQISYIKEGLNAVQLYLQRCRLRLEPGVEVLDIAPAWWEWMMNYRVWEANRKIFLYPENYLLPPLRKDKTTLFAQLESDLQQSEITPLYVEGAYTSYINSLYDLAQVRPVESYQGIISDPRRGHVKAHFVVGRSETEPYSFHLCRQLEGSDWSQWEPIDLDIVSPYVTLAYAFGKLFVFWAQLERVGIPSVTLGSDGGTTATNISYRANLRYSFQDRAGKWVQPQTLAQEQVVYFDGQGTDAVPLPGGKLFGSVFNMAGLPWHKVYAVRTGAANLGPGLHRGADDERLVVMYGNFLNDTKTESGDVGMVEPTTPDAAAFAARVVEASRNHDRVLRSRTSGSLPFWSAYVLDASLEDTVVVHRREFVLPDAYRPASPVAQFRADINQITGQVQAVVSGRPITDNYLADGEALDDAPASAPLLLSGSFVSDSITPDVAALVFATLTQAGVISGGKVVASTLPALDLYTTLGDLMATGTVEPNQLNAVQAVLYANAGAPVLFGAVADRARTLTVKNQPGWFVLDNADEAFLIRPAPPVTPGAPPVFGTLEEGLVTSAPPFNPTSFVHKNPAITTPQSRLIFSTLQDYDILDAHAVPDVTLATPKFLGFALGNLGLSSDQIRVISGALLNHPIVFPGSFVSPRVNMGLSGTIYGVLEDNGVIAHDGRVNMDVLTAVSLTLVLGNLLNAGSIGQRDVVAIYRTLVESSVPLGLNWWNTGTVGAFTPAGPFVTTRLTTAAVQRLERALFVGGIPKLLSLDMQNVPVVPILPFKRLQPAGGIRWPEAIDGAQVDFEGLYGRYFWELYYHAPMLVANSLAAAGEYREALTWFQFVFDPTVAEEFVEPLTFAEETHQLIDAALSASILTQLQDTKIGTPAMPIVSPEGRVNPGFNPTVSLAFLTNTTPEQQEMVSNVLMNYRLVSKAAFYWQFRPFRQRSLQTLTEELTDSAAIRMYNDEPFDPFAIARLRIGAFEKATVMQYIDTLLAWGDFYFAQDTWETLTAATLLYTYAGDLLGPRPQQVGVCSSGPPTDFKTIRETYAKTPGGIPQFLIYLETSLPPRPSVPGPDPVPVQAHAFNDLGAYFCVPENSLLVSYWDKVEDRLYKIRHSMNIQGQVRSLALFEPPLDPLALVRAGGASNSVLPGGGYTSPPVPAFRFSVMAERARALVATAAQLGSELLAALQNRDSEAFGLLRNTQEQQVLSLVTRVKELQVEEAKLGEESLSAALKGATERAAFYKGVLDTGLIASEQTNLNAMAVALAFNVTAGILDAAAAIGYAVPQVGSPFAMTYGGIQLGSIVQAAAAAAKVGAQVSDFVGQRAITMAGYTRRDQDWGLQQGQAEADVASLTLQVAAARSRVASAQRDLLIHEKSIAQNQEVDEFLRDKFTGEGLYQWMAGRLSSLYFQTYRMALDASLSAQTAWQFERGRGDTFVDFSYWDSMRKGLLAAEGLRLALDRMDALTGTVDTRALEIERTVSLASLNPLALQALRTHGVCEFDLPEVMYDYDYPGQYMRRIKNVSLSIPAVVGPYQNLKATLTQTRNVVVLKDEIAAVRFLLTGKGSAPAGTLREDWAPHQQVAVSRGVDDSGLFVVDFHDERYLPFEGTGAVSSWRLEMPKETNHFDFDQLTDVVLSVRYTARPSATLRPQVEAELATLPMTLGYYIDARKSYPVDWTAFMRDHSDPLAQTLSFTFTPEWRGYAKSLVLDRVLIRLGTRDVTWPAAPASFATLTIRDVAKTPDFLGGIAELSGLNLPREAFTGTWKLTLHLDAIKADPDLSTLLGGSDWLDPLRLLDVELIAMVKATVF